MFVNKPGRPFNISDDSHRVLIQTQLVPANYPRIANRRNLLCACLILKRAWQQHWKTVLCNRRSLPRRAAVRDCLHRNVTRISPVDTGLVTGAKHTQPEVQFSSGTWLLAQSGRFCRPMMVQPSGAHFAYVKSRCPELGVQLQGIVALCSALQALCLSTNKKHLEKCTQSAERSK